MTQAILNPKEGETILAVIVSKDDSNFYARGNKLWYKKKYSKHASEFDDKLKEIGSLYEEGKDCLNRIDLWGDQDHKRLYEILERLRTLAATQLVGTHKVNDN